MIIYSFKTTENAQFHQFAKVKISAIRHQFCQILQN